MKLSLLKDLALDWLAGFCALSIVAIVAIALRTISNFAVFLFFGSILFFLAGTVRASSSDKNPWVQGAIASMGASLPVLIIGRLAFAMHISRMFRGFVFLAALACGTGAQAEKLWTGRHRAAGVVTFLSLAIFVLIVGKFAVPRMLAVSNYEAVNQPAPEFMLAMLDGRSVSSQSLRGRVLVLDFWGTWCAPCVAEMPALSETYKQYKKNGDVVFLAVNSQWNDDDANKIRSLIKAQQFDVPVALDTTGVAKDFGVNSLPWLVVIDKAGQIRMNSSGYEKADQLQRKLTEEIDLLSKAN